MTGGPASDGPAEPSGDVRVPRRFGRRALLAGGAGALALAAGALLFRSRSAPARDGSALLAMVLPDPQGREQPLAQWRGKVLVVNFWATWCAPCREEMPGFIAAQTRDGAKGVQFIGIAVDDADKTEAFAREIGLNYPTLIGGYGAIELSRTLGNDLSALPFTVVLDREGRVAHTQLGPLKAAKLDDLLRGLLQAG